MKKQYLAGLAALVLVLAVCAVLFTRAGKNGEDNEDLYGDIIASLGDDEQYSLRDIGEKNYVLFTTDMTYDDGNGHNATVYCDV